MMFRNLTLQSLFGLLAVAVLVLSSWFFSPVPVHAQFQISCDLGPGPADRTLVELGSSELDWDDGKIRSGQGLERAYYGPVNVNMPAGTYQITLESYDDHSEFHEQPEEQYHLEFYNSGGSLITTSNSIRDIADNEERIEEVVDTALLINQPVASIIAMHSGFNSPEDYLVNSFLPTCAALDLVVSCDSPVLPNLPNVSIQQDESSNIDVSANSGTGPISYFVSGLPPGMSASGGVISGAPLLAGDYTVTVTASNSCGSDQETFTLTVTDTPPVCTAPTVSVVSDASREVGETFSQVLSASGTAPVSFSVSGLPPSLTFDGNNTISGTVTQAGNYTVTATGTNSCGSDDEIFVVTVTDPPPSCVEPTLSIIDSINLVEGQNFSYVISPVGTTPITLSASNLPPGLNLSGNTLSGSPTSTGTFSSSITATNSCGSDNASIIIDVSEQICTLPIINVASLVNGTVGQSFAYQVNTTGAGPISVSASGLPPGLTIQSNTIVGTPTTAGVYTVTLTATNTCGADSVQITININNPGGSCQAAVIPSISALTANLNSPFTYTVNVSGTAPIQRNVIGLPDGMSFNGTQISGTPTESGTFNIVVNASNVCGNDQESATLTIEPEPEPPPPPTPSCVPVSLGQPPAITVNRGETFIQTLTSSGTGPIIFMGHDLPSGVQVAPGEVRGKLWQVGTYVINITAQNSCGIESKDFIVKVIDDTPGVPLAELPETGFFTDFGIAEMGYVLGLIVVSGTITRILYRRRS